MTATIADVAVELARPTPDGPVAEQWQAWISRAYRMITARFGVDVVAGFDMETVDDVVTQAVAQYARAWRDTTASQYTVSVDDGSTTKRFEAAVGAFDIADDLWALLEPAPGGSGAFSISPRYEPDCPRFGW